MAKFDSSNLPSDRKFGFLFSVIFLIAAFFVAKKQEIPVAVSLCVLAGVIFLISLVSPHWLRPFNRIWMGFGHLLGRIVNPLVLGTLFYLIISPIGIITRAFGRDELRLKMIPRDTHWKARDKHQTSFKDQF